MDKKFTILLYKDMVKISYNDSQALSLTQFQKLHVKKIEISGSGMIQQFIRWQVKKFIENTLALVVSDIFEFINLDATNYDETN